MALSAVAARRLATQTSSASSPTTNGEKSQTISADSSADLAAATSLNPKLVDFKTPSEPSGSRRSLETRSKSTVVPSTTGHLQSGRQESDEPSTDTLNGRTEGDACTTSDQEGNEDEDNQLSSYLTPRPRKRRKVEIHDSASYPSVLSNFEARKDVNYTSLSSKSAQAWLHCTCDSADRGVIVALERSEFITLAGTCRITPLQGSLRVFGTILEPELSEGRIVGHPVFAPTSHPLPSVSPAGSPLGTTHGSEKLPTEVFPSTFVTDAKTVFLLQELHSGIEGLDLACARHIGTVWLSANSGVFDLRGCYPILRNPVRPVYPYQISSSWQCGLNTLPSPRNPAEEIGTAEDQDEQENRLRPLCCIVKGPKRSGKSTLAREILNRLLSTYHRVAYLDCDLGQSEFGSGGTVGLYLVDRPLLGPSFTHPRNAFRSHFLGSLAAHQQPEAYLSAISDLLDRYRYDIQYSAEGPEVNESSSRIHEVVPLVINTQGWVKGLGADLLEEIERMAQVTHVFAFERATAYEGEDDVREFGGTGISARQSTMTANSEGYGHTMAATVSLVDPPEASPLLGKYSSADHRLLSSMTDFQRTSTDQFDFTMPLVARKPYTVDLSVFRQCVLAGEGSEHILPEDVGYALEGSIVGLVASEEPMDQDTPFHVPGKPLPDPSSSECLGLAFIRSVSQDLKTLQLLTPVAPSSLSRVNVLVRGAMEMPLPGFIDWRHPLDLNSETVQIGEQTVEWEHIPYVSVRQDYGVGMGRRRWRRNVQRRGQQQG